MQNKDEIVKFYDEYSLRQLRVGVNERHEPIMKLLIENGHKKDHDVLEIGSGIGTLSVLLLNYMAYGSFIGIDISSESIRLGQERLKRYNNAVFYSADITEWVIDKKFDLIILPDVLEHIPVEVHNSIFVKLHFLLKNDGFVFIHIPDPNCLEWVRTNYPEQLQVIDQSLYAEHFLELANRSGFYITRFGGNYFNSSYSICHPPVVWPGIYRCYNALLLAGTWGDLQLSD